MREVAASGREAILSADRREVTALFGDLRGFTNTAEKLGPERVVSILNDHFEVLAGPAVPWWVRCGLPRGRAVRHLRRARGPR